MNILLTCAGRRNYLIEYFRDAVEGGVVLATDASPYAPAMLEADVGIVVPPVNAPDYVDTLERICREHHVDMIIPLNDLELPILARHRERLEDAGATVVVSTPEVIDLCFDKWKSVEFLRARGIAVPHTYLTADAALRAISSGELEFPVVVKPRWGTASIGIEMAADWNELLAAFEAVRVRAMDSIIGDVSRTHATEAVLIQQRLEGQEYGLDIVNDLQGSHVATLAKRKLAMRAGETDRAVSVLDDRLTALGQTVGTALGHVGNLDCDVFMEATGPVVLEMNPRFGGGYPFSHTAGADLPAALVAWTQGRTADPRWFEVTPDVLSAKCDRLVVANEGAPLYAMS